mgnify:CR=1 FL=1
MFLLVYNILLHGGSTLELNKFVFLAGLIVIWSCGYKNEAALYKTPIIKSLEVINSPNYGEAQYTSYEVKLLKPFLADYEALKDSGFTTQYVFLVNRSSRLSIQERAFLLERCSVRNENIVEKK